MPIQTDGSVYHMVVQPFSRMKTDAEYDSAKRPVTEHADPYGNWSKAPYTAEVNTQTYPAKPHGTAGSDH